MWRVKGRMENGEWQTVGLGRWAGARPVKSSVSCKKDFGVYTERCRRQWKGMIRGLIRSSLL